jgi:acyl-CoA thioester hydrolase
MPHEYTCHVRFSDVDVYGHVNNVKYFEYYQ